MTAPSPVRRLIAPAIASAVVFAILVSLGVWQLGRLAQKEALVAQVAGRIHDAPVPAPGPAAWPTLDVNAFDYTPVTVSGVFDHDAEVHLFMALTQPHGPMGGPGWMIYTPLKTDEGWIVYVDRGFVPDAMKRPETRAASQVPGRVTVRGLFRRPEHPVQFLMPGQGSGNEWFAREPARFAEAAGLPAASVAPYTIEADATPNPGGVPQGGETVVTFTNNHLQYAITWFGLAAVLVGVFAAYARSIVRRPPKP